MKKTTEMSIWQRPVEAAKTAIMYAYSTLVGIVCWPFHIVQTFLSWLFGFGGPKETTLRRESGNSDIISGGSQTSLVDSKTLKRRQRKEQMTKMKEDIRSMSGRMNAMEEQVREIDSSRYHLQSDLKDTKKMVESSKSEVKKTRDDMKTFRQEIEVKLKANELTLPLLAGSHTPRSKHSSTCSTPDGSCPSTPLSSRSLSFSQFEITGAHQVTMKLSNFTRLQTANQPWYSPPFETSKDGHCMCLEVYPNGRSGRGTHLSVYTFVVKGKNDDNLRWPFVGHVSVELLNQLNDDTHMKLDFGEYITLSPRVPDSMEMANTIGMPQFLPLTDLRFKPKQKCQYLRNDTLYFRVSIDMQNQPNMPISPTL